ncbi:protein kinase Yak1 [Rhizoctonia solani AG-1 IA]|uniref:Protein kinase Yak1 n=1 Tax=Thanatephorus cucumeris (strain AG1-IA) TaxID=983506 RepID=L8X0B2_THACA|nr:protein kinase Yak1 [Rhizoctonia solani AG-1 IA]
MSLHEGSYDDALELPRFAVRNPTHPQMDDSRFDNSRFDYYDDRRPAGSLSRTQSQHYQSHPQSLQSHAPHQQQQQQQQQPQQPDIERLSDPTRPLYYPYDPYAQAQEHIRRPSYNSSDPYAPPDAKPPPSPQFQYPIDQRFAAPRAPSASTPGTPMTSSYQRQFYSPKPRQGFRHVRDPKDLQPRVNPVPPGRRFADGAYLSPLRALTTHLTQTYHICNPEFRYESTHNPRRVLTKPSKPVHNDGYDNEDYDYILYVNDWLGPDDGRNKYLILDVLGQGTFGQVVKCQNIKTHEIVAVKVVKNKPAYFNQSMMEVTILELVSYQFRGAFFPKRKSRLTSLQLNTTWDPNDEHHILRMRDQFIHKNHLCLVFELLSSNLYELIKQNQFGGLSTQLVKVFTAQLLDALTVLNEARLIHCDLKPENILLMSLQSPQIKVIDFGSACHERQTVYTYIQSRFYRSPEVLLGMSYTSAIDMWSLGCIAVELFLGLPLFPGTSEYNQTTRIVEMLGMPPMYMLEMGKQTNNFFASYTDEYGRKRYRLKSIEQYSRENNTNEQPGKKYFAATTLPDIIRSAAGSGKGKLTENDKAPPVGRESCGGGMMFDDPGRCADGMTRSAPIIELGRAIVLIFYSIIRIRPC